MRCLRTKRRERPRAGVGSNNTAAPDRRPNDQQCLPIVARGPESGCHQRWLAGFGTDGDHHSRCDGGSAVVRCFPQQPGSTVFPFGRGLTGSRRAARGSVAPGFESRPPHGAQRGYGSGIVRVVQAVQDSPPWNAGRLTPVSGRKILPFVADTWPLGALIVRLLMICTMITQGKGPS